ncbi:MAG: hypothetical protein M3O28_08650 [Actinomycetota bacterium]|nr:hypothetical protein [Actinomycetota bacterium]
MPREIHDGPWQVMLTDLDEPGVVWWGLSILSLLALRDLCSKYGASAEVTLEARQQMHDAGIWGSQSRTRHR